MGLAISKAMSATFDTTRLFEPVINTLVGVIDSEFQPFSFPHRGRWENSELEQKENDYFLELEVPGFSKKNLSITIDQDNLRVKGKVKRNEKDHTIDRAFSIPKDVDTKGVSAKLENGLLTVTLSKLSPPKESVIKIN